MQRMGFTAPALDSLISQALSLSNEYHRRRPQDANPVREQQIREIEAVHRQIQAIQHASPRDASYPDELLLKISIGVWTCALERIEQEYIGRNPLPSNHSMLGHGSVLSELITKALGIAPANAMNDECRLIYLTELHHFNVSSSDMDMQNHIENAMSAVLARLMTGIKKLIDAVPTAEVLQSEFSTLYSRYAQKRLTSQPFYAPRVDEDRPLCAQLSQVVASILPIDHQTENKEESDRHYKVMLGLLIYMMRTIKGDRSKLYQLCEAMMNGGPDTLSVAAQFDCLVTLENFLKDNRVLQRIAEEGHKQFGRDNRLVNLDTKLRMITVRLEHELKILCPDQTSSMTGAKIFGTVGALAAYPVGYGTGRVLGTVGAGAESKMNANLKEFITMWINKNAHYLLGLRGNGVGYLATTPIVTAVYQTVAGNLLGSAFALTGGLMAGGVGYLVIDLFLRNLYQYTTQSMMHHRDPLYAMHFNQELLDCLENLPNNLLDEAKKEKMARVTGHTHRLMLMDHARDDNEQKRESVTAGISQMP